MEIKNIEEFKIGEYYHSILRDSSPERFLITRCSGNEDNERIKGDYISNMNGNWEFKKLNTPCLISDDRTTRKATIQEKFWLEQCLRNNKFIPLKALKVEYEIF